MANPAPNTDGLKPPWKPGESGNPEGRPKAGATLREEINIIVDQRLTEEGVRRILSDKTITMEKRVAALRYLRLVENPDVAMFEKWLRGEKTLTELKEAGYPVETIKKAKIGDKGGRELELHDRSGADFDRVVEQTDGKPKQPLDVSGKMTWEPAPVNQLALPAHLAEKMAK